MFDYGACFHDHDGRVFSTETFRAEDHKRAVAYAKRVFHSGIGSGFQLWRGEHRVYPAAPEEAGGSATDYSGMSSG